MNLSPPFLESCISWIFNLNEKLLYVFFFEYVYFLIYWIVFLFHFLNCTGIDRWWLWRFLINEFVCTLLLLHPLWYVSHGRKSLSFLFVCLADNNRLMSVANQFHNLLDWIIPDWLLLWSFGIFIYLTAVEMLFVVVIGCFIFWFSICFISFSSLFLFYLPGLSAMGCQSVSQSGRKWFIEKRRNTRSLGCCFVHSDLLSGSSVYSTFL